MITLSQYFGHWGNHRDATPERVANAETLLEKVNRLLAAYRDELPVNPVTQSNVSGAKFGGFRPMDCTQGAATSSHKDGRGVDVFDPKGELDAWLTDGILEAYGLYREHPEKTDGWCHLTDRAPPSKRRTFWP